MDEICETLYSLASIACTWPCIKKSCTIDRKCESLDPCAHRVLYRRATRRVIRVIHTATNDSGVLSPIGARASRDSPLEGPGPRIEWKMLPIYVIVASHLTICRFGYARSYGRIQQMMAKITYIRQGYLCSANH